MYRPKILVFASGTRDSGGSGFENLVKQSRQHRLKAEIVGVVSNHQNGGVRRRAEELGIRFFYFPGPWTGKKYQKFIKKSRADFVALSGWLKLGKGLNPCRTINIHPGPLPEFGGKGMFGHHVHEAVMKAYHAKALTHTEVCMHFVNKPKMGSDDYDRGPVIFRWPVPILPNDTPESLAKRVLAVEHEWQPIVTNWVVNRLIKWSGRQADEPVFWHGYTFYNRRELPAVIARPIVTPVHVSIAQAA